MNHRRFRLFLTPLVIIFVGVFLFTGTFHVSPVQNVMAKAKKIKKTVKKTVKKKVKKAKKVQPPVKRVQERVDYLEWEAIKKERLPFRLTPTPLVTECAALSQTEPAKAVGKSAPVQKEVGYIAEVRSTSKTSATKTTYKRETKKQLWWTYPLDFSKATLNDQRCFTLPAASGEYGGTKEREGKNAMEHLDNFLASLGTAIDKHDTDLDTIAEAVPAFVTSERKIGPWRVTEAMRPTGTHHSACHYVGCAIDIALCPWETGCPGHLPGSGSVPTNQERYASLWDLIRKHYLMGTERWEICGAYNETRWGKKKAGVKDHIHIEAYPCLKEGALIGGTFYNLRNDSEARALYLLLVAQNKIPDPQFDLERLRSVLLREGMFYDLVLDNGKVYNLISNRRVKELE